MTSIPEMSIADKDTFWCISICPDVHPKTKFLIHSYQRWDSELESELTLFPCGQNRNRNRSYNLMLELESESNYSQRNRNRNRMCQNSPISYSYTKLGRIVCCLYVVVFKMKTSIIIKWFQFNEYKLLDFDQYFYCSDIIYNTYNLQLNFNFYVQFNLIINRYKTQPNHHKETQI